MNSPGLTLHVICIWWYNQMTLTSRGGLNWHTKQYCRLPAILLHGNASSSLLDQVRIAKLQEIQFTNTIPTEGHVKQYLYTLCYRDLLSKISFCRFDFASLFSEYVPEAYVVFFNEFQNVKCNLLVFLCCCGWRSFLTSNVRKGDCGVKLLKMNSLGKWI